ncbi:MAG: DUF503 domain-containing protein [Atribacterota bacterium]|nr:DUF503 domain-containing protein [Atribacterota bacterium]MDD4896557.1 DUF503 domain-containing protein [Atribacterota bacterium]MDD5636261.1 DUF503 domain-containing protein [Atribacterota bacterium]
MLVGICEIIIYLPNSHSLKDKRSILESYKASLRKKYNISIAEIDQKNIWKKSIMGIVCISDNRGAIDHIFQKIIRITENHSEIQLLNYRISVN